MRLILGILLLAGISSPAAAGTIGTDNRLPIAEYAKRHGMDAIAARQLFGASGRIKCPSYASSAFLVYRSDIVMTARHVVAPASSATWVRPSHCAFEVSRDGITSTWYDVDVNTIQYPAENPRFAGDRLDWIIMKLTKPIPDVRPYELAGVAPAANDSVTSITVNQDGLPYNDWNERIVEDCEVRDVVDIDGVPGSGLRVDCSATKGASGGALVRSGAGGLEAVGVLTASTGSCEEYSTFSCFSFAVGISEDVKQAIRALAGEQ